ncbi:MAG: hypothetical protein CL663_00945 [Bacteroidetes bacterium]|nr:hypothetical protein [Bacteroidota bacterium]|tara:strand:- start:652 stop:1680 length:1029 start_codon:yes stop_codon:yes gene_type:complete
MIFITGGTGLVGAHLIYDLLLVDKKIKVLRRKNSNTKKVLQTFCYYTSEEKALELYDRIQWVEGDILDIECLNEHISPGDTVYHCAAIISFDPKDRERMIDDNVQGTANVVNICLEKKVKTLCHVSSSAAIGRDHASDEVTEEHAWQYHSKISAYSISKHESEREVWRGIAEGLNAVIVNPSIILGPGDWTSGSSKIFLSIYEGLKFYTNGITGYVDVRDVVKAMQKLVEAEINSERFILNAENVAFKDLFADIAIGLKVKAPHILAKKWMSEIVWRVEAFKSLITGSKPIITRETAFTANKQYQFSSNKLLTSIEFSYRSVSSSVSDFCKLFLKDMSKNMH